jgi:hypothetical protein
LHGRKHGLNQGVLGGVEIAVVGGADDVIGPMIVAVIAVHAACYVGPYPAVRILHFQKVRIPPAQFLFERRQSRPGKVPSGSQMTCDRQQPKGVHHCRVHPLPQVARIVPAAGRIYMDARIPAARIIEMADRMHIRHCNPAALRAMIADHNRKEATPGVRTDEKGR